MQADECWRIGTTSVRVLESAAQHHYASGLGSWRLGAARRTSSFVPPYQFQFVDALLTNFHLPKSTLLMLVSAFAVTS